MELSLPGVSPGAQEQGQCPADQVTMPPFQARLSRWPSAQPRPLQAERGRLRTACLCPHFPVSPVPPSVSLSLSAFPHWAPSSPAGLCVSNPPCLCLISLLLPFVPPLPPSSLLPPSLHPPSSFLLSPFPPLSLSRPLQTARSDQEKDIFLSLPFLPSLLPPCSASLILCGPEGSCSGGSEG